MDAKKTGELIAVLRKEKGWSQTELAERLGVTNKAVSRWETGRGYPDVELLPQLAKALDITISELLEGERSPEPPRVEEQMEFLCENTRREKNRIAWIAAIIAAVLLLTGCFCVYSFFALREYSEAIVGLEGCVMSADYSKLTYFGEVYLPLPMEDCSWAADDELVSEVQVEGQGFWDKLFFGDSLYSVLGNPNYEMVYLYTDLDEPPSNFYVKESKFSEYAKKLEQAEFTVPVAFLHQEDWNGRTIEMVPEVLTAIADAQKTEPVDLGYRQCDSFDMMLCDRERLFWRVGGTFLLCEGVCYWEPTMWGNRPTYRIADAHQDLIGSYFAMQGDGIS